MIGRKHKGAIMTKNDRCTHLVLIRRLAGKEATQLASTAIEALRPYKEKTHTITADNGKEFARHKEIAKGLDAEFYFARPYHSWERGANKNTNGLIHQYIPKGADFSKLTNEMFAEIEWKLNHRPRKSLVYRRP
jgi:Transposase and inactivated derivatives, IS30 family